ncbi:MAG: type II secretion system protein GspH [Proteobacteria bacterium]|nr:MAG: type II secretion system protein GspH [Pseudomonadota bacterium]
MISRQIKKQAGNNKKKGFTLIEILVVLVLIGVIASVSVLGIGNDNQGRELVNEVKRLHALMRLIADEAVLHNSEYGFFIDSDGYEFLAYNEENNLWSVTSEPPFAARSLPEWLTVSVRQDSDFPRLKTKDEEETKIPQIVFLSSGEMTPFRLFFDMQAGESEKFGIESDGFTGIKLILPGADDDF